MMFKWFKRWIEFEKQLKMMGEIINKKSYLKGYNHGYRKAMTIRNGIEKAENDWHDLRKNPMDLPPKMISNPNFSIDVLSDRGEIVCFNFYTCEWFYWRNGNPIAWREIPHFER